MAQSSRPPERRDRTRRGLLRGGVALGAAATAGCLQRTRNMLGRQPGEQVSLSVRTVPADEDRAATAVARTLVDNLTAAGVDAEVVLQPAEELRRTVLVTQEFDCYVDRLPLDADPDALRPLLGSSFAGEPGWQNPFGFASLGVDDLLDAQRRREGLDRRNAVRDLQRAVARQQPFTVVGFPDEIRAIRDDRFVGWGAVPPSDPLSFLALGRAGTTGATGPDDGTGRRLVVTVTEDGATRNFNPIAVEFRDRGTFTGLLYDPLARRFGGAVDPWLAADWTFEGGDTTMATVRLREGLGWHDGTPLTADDVAFTYRFLADTTLGDGDDPVPAPRFRGRVSLVEAATAVDDRTVQLGFGDTAPEAAARSFTVPVLPRHEWASTATEAELVGIAPFEGVTEALVWENPEPVGSGPLRFDGAVAGEQLTLARNEDHFLHAEPPPALADRFDGGVAFEELVARVAPSAPAAVELVAAGEADATAGAVDPTVVPDIGRADALDLLVTPSRSCYHVGFNVRREPLSNQRFRRAVARLLDDEHLATGVFDGYLTPSAVPLPERRWTPPDLRWDGEDPEVPFAGTDGDLDAAAARDLFRAAGYDYADGVLRSR